MRNVTIAVAGLLAIVLLTKVAGIAKDPPAAKPDNRFFVIVVPPPLTSALDLRPRPPPPTSGLRPLTSFSRLSPHLPRSLAWSVFGGFSPLFATARVVSAPKLRQIDWRGVAVPAILLRCPWTKT